MVPMEQPKKCLVLSAQYRVFSARAPTAPAPPQGGEGEANDDSQHAHGTVPEDNRAIENHEEKEAVPKAAQPAGAPSETLRTEPPPEHIGQPRGREDVVEINAAAPVSTGERGGLSRRFPVRLRMTPMMEKAKGANHMEEEEDAAERPYPAGACLPNAPSAWLQHQPRGDDIRDQRQPDTKPREKIAVVHGGLALCSAAVSSICHT